jgi:hypothetical protein
MLTQVRVACLATALFLSTLGGAYAEGNDVRYQPGMSQSAQTVAAPTPFVGPKADIALPQPTSSKRVAYLFCGLLSFDICGLNNLAAEFRARGVEAHVYSHWATPDLVSSAARAAGKEIIYVGHSKGADNVVASTGAHKVYSIDATVANSGAKIKNTWNWYNPRNRIPAVICCGGARVNGANNVIWRMPHVAMGSDPKLHAVILSKALAHRKAKKKK